MSHRHSYKLIKREIEYRSSAQQQKFVWSEEDCCRFCGHPKKFSKRYYSCELDSIPSFFNNVDLSKIIHEHDDKTIGNDYYKDPVYDEEGNCIKATRVDVYNCKICGTIVKSVEYEVINTGNDRRMDQYTIEGKQRIERRKKMEEEKRFLELHKTTNICPKTNKPFELEKHCVGISDRPFAESTYYYGWCCSECGTSISEAGSEKEDRMYHSGYWWK